MSYTEQEKKLFGAAVDLNMADVITRLSAIHKVLADPDTSVFKLERQMDVNTAIVDFLARIKDLYGDALMEGDV